MSSSLAMPAMDQVVRPTTIIESLDLNDSLRMRVILASETFQRTGSFKFRAAYNVATTVREPLLITASSGNFGQALACACNITGKSCIVVMPDTSAEVKIRGVRGYGGRVELIDTQSKTRLQRIQELAIEYPEAYVASPFDDPLVIEGNSTLGMEISALDVEIDCIVAPIGGGGLTSGIIVGLRKAGKPISVVAAEPSLANDAARSFRLGTIVDNGREPPTIADGARSMCLGKHNWEILRDGLTAVVEVSEESIKEALRLLFKLANLKVEPTGALSVAALLTEPEMFVGRTVCCVISGGNVDASVYADIIRE